MVDGTVSAVVLTRWDPAPEVVAGLGTWLGPTLGSPVEAASELPGARTSGRAAARPGGAGGHRRPRLRLDGVDVVFSDAIYDMSAVTEQARGRITTVEVRNPRARHCTQQALSELGPRIWAGPPPAPGTDLTLGLDGVAAAPIGSSAGDLVARLGLSSDGLQGPCRRLLGSHPGGRLRCGWWPWTASWSRPGSRSPA